MISGEVGVAADHDIGIRTLNRRWQDRTRTCEGCGPVRDGQDAIMTYINGKRCWINKVIFGEPAATQLASNADAAKRPVFVAGDSDTDVSMLKDATYLKLAIDRNKTELMCNAYADYMERWLVQPMFIAPKTVPASYPCAITVDPDGDLIVDEAGDPIPDQIPD